MIRNMYVILLYFRDMGYILGQMEGNMRGSGLRGNSMGRGNTYYWMVALRRGIGLMAKR